MFISYQNHGGVLYARLTKSVRVDGKVRKEPGINLGRVLDKARGIYQNRERGIFTYDPVTQEYGEAPADFVPPVRRNNNARERLSTDFGDAFLVNALLSGSEMRGLRGAIAAMTCDETETLYALLLYYVLQQHSTAFAHIWYEGSFARFLYPKARLTQQHINKLLTELGDTERMQTFFATYHTLACDRLRAGTHVLIDSTGLPASTRFPVTAVQSPDGVISGEMRVISVLQQGTNMPVFLRCVPENGSEGGSEGGLEGGPENSPGDSLKTAPVLATVRELRARGIAVEMAVLDAETITWEGLRQLHEAGIPFLVQCPAMSLTKGLAQPLTNTPGESSTCCQAQALDQGQEQGQEQGLDQALAKGLATLEEADKVDAARDSGLCNDRHLSLTCVRTELHGLPLCVHIGRNKTMQELARTRILKGAAGVLPRLEPAALHRQLSLSGVFVLLSSHPLQAQCVLEYCRMRQEMALVPGMTRQDAPLLHMHVEPEAAVRGHLLLTFLATIIRRRMQAILRDKFRDKQARQHASVFSMMQAPGDDPGHDPAQPPAQLPDDVLDHMLLRMQTHKAKVCDTVVLPCEPDEEHKRIYRLFGVRPAKEYPVSPG